MVFQKKICDVVQLKVAYVIHFYGFLQTQIMNICLLYIYEVG